MSIQENLDQTITALKEIITIKFPNVSFDKPYNHLSNRYDHTGNGLIGSYYKSSFKFVTVAPESSHPDLRASKTSVKIQIVYENGERKISLDFPIDSVVKWYMIFDARTNKRNVTLGRAYNRKVVKWSSEQLRKKFEFVQELDTTTNDNLIEMIALDKENTFIINKAHTIAREVKAKPINYSSYSSHGFTKVKNTYFFNDKKVGSKSILFHFVKNNIQLFLTDFVNVCPVTAMKLSL